MVDFDNDGDKDIYVTNGYIKDVIDLDYIQFSNPSNPFAPKLNTVEKLQEDLPAIELPNIFFEQTEKEVFEEVSQTWIEDRISLSNGMAYADLDLDELNRRFFSNPNSTSVFFVRHPFVRMISAFQVSQINI